MADYTPKYLYIFCDSSDDSSDLPPPDQPHQRVCTDEDPPSGVPSSPRASDDENVDERELDRQRHEQHRERLIQEQRECDARAAAVTAAAQAPTLAPAPALAAAAANE